MSDTFRDLLKLVGSGPHTGKNLSREQAKSATLAMLTGEATPAQIGAFMIAHRIRRPTPVEMAGMFDAYKTLGGQLQPRLDQPEPLVFRIPYDGRTRTAPVSPLTALVIATAGVPAIQHGGDRMPTKHGICLVELWQQLGVDWIGLLIEQSQAIFETQQIGFVYQPQHFPAAETLVTYRDQIGKRPPFATLELVWTPYTGAATTIAGYVHPPTEHILQQTCRAVGGFHRFVAVKGLEGSCDLPRNRTGIASIDALDGTEPERLLLHPREFGMGGEELPCVSGEDWGRSMQAVLQGEAGVWLDTCVWNGGFYLWLAGAADTIAGGVDIARELLVSGKVLAHLQGLQAAIAAVRGAPFDS
ncbi:MAG: anthranilate phosphoribosyltransferase family protein [Cyanobacteria bacterium P01_G01_bin.4]